MKRMGLCAFYGFTLLWNQTLNAQVITLRDPTQPVIMDLPITEVAKETGEAYILLSIIISPKRRLALINDHYVKVGDRVGEAKVELIESNFVVLSRAGQKRTLYLFNLENWEKGT